MAEAQQEKRESGGFHTIKNIFKGIGRSMGLPLHQTQSDPKLLPTYINLNSEMNFRAISQLNEAMRQAEETWDGIPSKDNPAGNVFSEETQKSAGFIKDQIIKLYTEPGDDINTSIGPFTDKTALNDEGAAADKGSSPLDTNGNPIFKTETLKIRKYGDVIESNFSIPQEKVITYKDSTGSRSYKVVFAGRVNESYWKQMGEISQEGGQITEENGEIDEICRKVLERSLQTETDPTIRQNIESNVGIINKKIKSLMGSFKKYQKEFEEEHRSKLIGGGGVIKHWNNTEKLREDILKLKLTDEQVVYVHTYKVIKPETIQNGNVIRLVDVMPNFKLPEEEEVGFDKNGYPLEVGDGTTRFTNDSGNRRVLEEGIVLIDLYEGRTPRQVPKEFIEDVDLLDLSVWIYVHYDAYRDDLRDGRYHPKAISVMERIMTELKIPELKHRQTNRDIREGTHAQITMDLNKNPALGIYPRGPTGPTSFSMAIKPTHLNPAFDTRVFRSSTSGKTRHRGRKYYYDLQENSYGTLYGEPSPHPTIGTRGAALYILHRVIEETKYWSSEQAPPGNIGVIELLKAIGDATDGFDIGPNLGPNFGRWGLKLTRDPFMPQQPGG